MLIIIYNYSNSDYTIICFPGNAKVKLENKGDLSFFAKQDEAVSLFEIKLNMK